MITLLSPAKKLDYVALQSERQSSPRFLPASHQLIKRLRELSTLEVAQLMSLSAKLAELNYQRYQDFQTVDEPGNCYPALSLFRGDVYLGLQAPSLSAKDLEYAQDNLRILSGLYGLLRPLDLIQPYRLEMGCKLATDAAKDLYGFWGNKLTEHLQQELESHSNPVIVNLASQEYFRALPGVRLRSVDVKFLDYKSGVYKSIFLYAKRARGLMARFIVQNRLHNPEQLRDFDCEGYSFDSSRSTVDSLVFIRDKVPQKA